VRDRYPDGVRFVPLAPLPEAALVLSRIAEALGVRQVDGRASASNR
jgi:predicted ATPase